MATAQYNGSGNPFAIFNTKAPLVPTFQNTTSLEVAMQQNTLGIGYAGAGYLLFYYIGVSKVLQQLGVIKPGHTKTAGSSAGILSAAVDYGFVSHDEFIHYGKEFAARCRANHNCAGTLGKEIARVSEKITPPDAAEKINGVGYIALSSPNWSGFPVGDYAANYSSRQDVLDAVYAGVYVPLWSGPTITTKYKGKKKYDGAFRTPLPCPLGNTTYCIKVSVLPLGWNLNDVAQELSEPSVWPVIDDWFTTTWGTKAGRWILQSLWGQVRHPFEDWPQMWAGWLAFFTHQPKEGVDIYPGKYNKNPYSLVRWILMILAPPTEDNFDIMVEMGKRDAEAWAREQGLMPPEAAAEAKERAPLVAPPVPAAARRSSRDARERAPYGAGGGGDDGGDTGGGSWLPPLPRLPFYLPKLPEAMRKPMIMWAPSPRVSPGAMVSPAASQAAASDSRPPALDAAQAPSTTAVLKSVTPKADQSANPTATPRLPFKMMWLPPVADPAAATPAARPAASRAASHLEPEAPSTPV